jgi:type IV secretory pathway TraG/TraD family ATPase VirD4
VSATSSPGASSFAIEKLVVGVTGAALALAAIIHGTGWLLAFVTGRPTPRFSAGNVVQAMGLHPYVPGLPPVVHGIVVLAVLGTTAFLASRMVKGRRYRASAPKQRAAQFDGRDGWASSEAVRRAASTRTLMAQSDNLRPGLSKPSRTDLGYYLGSSRGEDVWASCERSILVVGPPGSGKGLHLAINTILDAPGAVITTSTKPDNIKATILARSRRGPAGVFDPQGMLGSTFEHLVAWDAIGGCEDPIRAATRADALAANTGISTTGENAVWRGHAKTIIECILHAAALNGDTIETAYRWMQSPHAMQTPLAVLRAHSQSCATWDDRLRGLIENPDPRFVGSVMSVVGSAISPLSLPSVRAALTPTASRPPFSADRLLAENGTLYCLATDRGAAASAGFVSALIEDIAFTARVKAARSPGGRVDPPVLFLLDECANVAPIPSLPALLADGRGQSLTIVPIFQTLAQVRSRYGDEDASTVFSASQVKLILGGSDDADDCRDISNLVGERDDWFTTSSRSSHSLAIDKNATTSTSLRKVPILPPDAIRAIPFGSAVMLQSQTEPFPLRMRPWTARPDADRIKSESEIVEAAILAANEAELALEGGAQ